MTLKTKPSCAGVTRASPAAAGAIDSLDHPIRKIPLSCGVLSLDDPPAFTRSAL
jgi:hypothetical protein